MGAQCQLKSVVLMRRDAWPNLLRSLADHQVRRGIRARIEQESEIRRNVWIGRWYEQRPGRRGRDRGIGRVVAIQRLAVEFGRRPKVEGRVREGRYLLQRYFQVIPGSDVVRVLAIIEKPRILIPLATEIHDAAGVAVADRKDAAIRVDAERVARRDGAACVAVACEQPVDRRLRRAVPARKEYPLRNDRRSDRQKTAVRPDATGARAKVVKLDRGNFAFAPEYGLALGIADVAKHLATARGE